MKFRLFYRGRLRSNQSVGEKIKHKQEIRRYFHPQLSRLWSVDHYLKNNLKDSDKYLFQRNKFSFLPIVGEHFNTICKLDILFLRPERPGNVRGDIDNRIKTLLDSMRVPSESEIPSDDLPREDENPIYCLLEDDSFIKDMSVTTDYLLDSLDDKEVITIITVTVSLTKSNLFNSDFV